MKIKTFKEFVQTLGEAEVKGLIIEKGILYVNFGGAGSSMMTKGFPIKEGPIAPYIEFDEYWDALDVIQGLGFTAHEAEEELGNLKIFSDNSEFLMAVVQLEKLAKEKGVRFDIR